MYLYLNESCMKEDNWFILFVENITYYWNTTFVIIFHLKPRPTEMLSFNQFATKIESGQVDKHTGTLK